jgi:hypothetical protein
MSLYSTKLDQLYRFIAEKIILSRNLYHFIGGKNFGQKIVSLYSIFFSKIVYLYCFKRYIFEYRCPSLEGSNYPVLGSPISVGGRGECPNKIPAGQSGPGFSLLALSVFSSSLYLWFLLNKVQPA